MPASRAEYVINASRSSRKGRWRFSTAMRPDSLGEPRSVLGLITHLRRVLHSSIWVCFHGMQHGDNLILLSIFYSGSWNFNYLPRLPCLFHPMNNKPRSGTIAPSVCSLRASTFSLVCYDVNRGENREQLGVTTVSPFNNSLTTSLAVRNNWGIQRLFYRTIYTTTK